jgi:hypothetical protein
VKQAVAITINAAQGCDIGVGSRDPTTIESRKHGVGPTPAVLMGR